MQKLNPLIAAALKDLEDLKRDPFSKEIHDAHRAIQGWLLPLIEAMRKDPNLTKKVWEQIQPEVQQSMRSFVTSPEDLGSLATDIIGPLLRLFDDDLVPRIFYRIAILHRRDKKEILKIIHKMAKETVKAKS